MRQITCRTCSAVRALWWSRTPTSCRAVATPLINELRQAVGLRRMVAVQEPKAAAAQQAKSALPVFKQYRDADNKFYFKLTDAHGALLLQSEGFAEGREAGGWVKRGIITH